MKIAGCFALRTMAFTLKGNTGARGARCYRSILTAPSGNSVHARCGGRERIEPIASSGGSASSATCVDPALKKQTNDWRSPHDKNEPPAEPREALTALRLS